MIAATLAAIAGTSLAGLAATGSASEKVGTATQTGTGTSTGNLPDHRVQFTVSAKKTQKAGKPIHVKVSCQEVCQVSVSGLLSARKGHGGKETRRTSFKLKKVTVALGAGESKTVALKLAKPAKRATLKAVKSGGRANAKIGVDARDLAGNRASKKLKVTLR